MSAYHLMRNFIALLRMLGYSRFVSLENFRRPNFPLMADILVYLLKRFDSTIEMTVKVDTEQERLAFVRRSSQIMVSKAHLDVNTKKLYMADINSVPEMLKLGKLIYDAWKGVKANTRPTSESDELGEDTEAESAVENGFDRNMYNNFKTNELTSEILQLGTQLYDLLGEEEANKTQRQQVLSKQIVIEQIETTLRASIGQLQGEMSRMQDTKEGLDQDTEDLNLKIEKKYGELTRNRKRLQTLTAQRPVYMDELEKVEAEIIQLYDTYVVNSRCLFFLEQKLEEFEEVEKMKIEERNEEIKQMLEQMRADEFLKEGKDMKLRKEGANGDGALVLMEDDEVDIPSDDGEGSDISDAIARDLEVSSRMTARQKAPPPFGMAPTAGNKKAPKLGALQKKERSLLVNTTVVNKREPRSSKTARIYSYGSLLVEDDDDDEDGDIGEDDDEDSELSKSEEIDLDGIESDGDSTGSANLNLSDDYAPQGRSKPVIPNAAKLTSKLSFDKSDDNF